MSVPGKMEIMAVNYPTSPMPCRRVQMPTKVSSWWHPARSHLLSCVHVLLTDNVLMLTDNVGMYLIQGQYMFTLNVCLYFNFK